MRFTKLRLTGFKSFVDPTDLLIRDGLTGVVGPNGCGKSNLLEALRWVMGAVLTLLIFWRHRSNITRLRKGTEPKIGRG